MKYFIEQKKWIPLFLIFGVILISCSEQKEDKTINSQNKELVDSLSIEKIEKSKEIKELNLALDSLKKIRDGLKINEVISEEK